MNGPSWRPQSLKLRIYEGIYLLNQGFQVTLGALERLENLGFFRPEHLNAFKIELEHARADANSELMESLHQHELEEAARFDDMRREREEQLKDPDDVFLHANARKEEIKEQLKTLQNSLDRLKTKNKKKKSSRKYKTPHR